MENPDLRVEKTRRIIRETVLQLLCEKPLQKITISEICARAEINRKTFYRHYRAVDDVIAQLEDGLLGEFSDVGKSGKSILDVGAVIRDIGEVIGVRREYFLRLMQHNSELFTKGKIKAVMRKLVCAALKSTGDLENENIVNAAAEFSVSGLMSLYEAWFEGSCREDPALITEIAVKMVTRGLAAFVSEEKLSELELK